MDGLFVVGEQPVQLAERQQRRRRRRCGQRARAAGYVQVREGHGARVQARRQQQEPGRTLHTSNDESHWPHLGRRGTMSCTSLVSARQGGGGARVGLVDVVERHATRVRGEVLAPDGAHLDRLAERLARRGELLRVLLHPATHARQL